MRIIGLNKDWFNLRNGVQEMIKKAFFHDKSSSFDNCDISGSFYESAPLRIQWILKESWGVNATAVSNFCYNDWWSWDNNGIKNPRHVQRFTRLISYCLIESYLNNELVLPSTLKKQNNKEKGKDDGRFKSALKQTSVVNIIESTTTFSKTQDSRLTEAWNNAKRDICDTIKLADPKVLIFCVKPNLFLKWVKKLPCNVRKIKKKKALYLQEDLFNNKRFVVVMRHPGQGFSYDNADEIIKEYCNWSKTP